MGGLEGLAISDLKREGQRKLLVQFNLDHPGGHDVCKEGPNTPGQRGFMTVLLFGDCLVVLLVVRYGSDCWVALVWFSQMRSWYTN